MDVQSLDHWTPGNAHHHFLSNNLTNYFGVVSSWVDGTILFASFYSLNFMMSTIALTNKKKKFEHKAKRKTLTSHFKDTVKKKWSTTTPDQGDARPSTKQSRTLNGALQARSGRQVLGEPDEATPLHRPPLSLLGSEPDHQGTENWKVKATLVVGTLPAGRESKVLKHSHLSQAQHVGGTVSTGARPLVLQTCVVPPLHGAMMTAHGIQVIDVVLRVSPESVGPSPWRPVGRQTPAALASLNHARCHVQASQRELDRVLKFHTLVSFLLKSLDSIIKKERHYFADKGLSSQSYGFSSSHV